MPNTTAFCARCNESKDSTVTVDPNGEYLVVCGDCAHTIKFPADCNLREAIDLHNEHNVTRTLVNEDGSIILTQEQQAQLDSL